MPMGQPTGSGFRGVRLRLWSGGPGQLRNRTHPCRQAWLPLRFDGEQGGNAVPVPLPAERQAEPENYRFLAHILQDVCPVLQGSSISAAGPSHKHGRDSGLFLDSSLLPPPVWPPIPQIGFPGSNRAGASDLKASCTRSLSGSMPPSASTSPCCKRIWMDPSPTVACWRLVG